MQYEIEVKSLVGGEVAASNFRETLIAIGAKFIGTETQKNHYFKDGNPVELFRHLGDLVFLSDHDLMRQIVEGGKKISVRTRETDGSEVRFVMKASVDDNSSENGVTRMELDVVLPVTLEEIDNRILECGYSYQAKWSRTRDTYTFEDVTIALDKNAGYGYLAEFEIVTSQSLQATEIMHAKSRITDVMSALRVQELPQDRLERMFAHYNDHWEEYYGTDKTFVVE